MNTTRHAGGAGRAFAFWLWAAVIIGGLTSMITLPVLGR